MAGTVLVVQIGLFAFWAAFIFVLTLRPPVSWPSRLVYIVTGLLGVFSGFVLLMFLVMEAEGGPIRHPSVPAPTFAGTLAKLFTEYLVGVLAALVTWGAGARCLIKGTVGPAR